MNIPHHRRPLRLPSEAFSRARWQWLCALVVAAFLFACAAAPDRTQQRAIELGYVRLELEGSAFAHVAFFKPGEPRTSLHVYIEHDGIPWITLTQPSADPTPRRLIMLEMMASDSAPSLYLGRPCYFGLSTRAPCEPIWWTHRRFSPEVVSSMNAAVSAFLATNPHIERLEVYGFSGGGVLAVLMAPGIPQTQRVITAAAPLDIDAWTTLHGYSTLAGSLSPMRQPPLAVRIAQLHLVGGRDDVVTIDMVRPFVERQSGAELRSLETFDHHCCWERTWTSVITPN